MQICIIGYYFWPNFYECVDSQKREHIKPFVVSHRDRTLTEDFLSKCSIPFYCRYNVGLEWGAYNWFLFNKWDGVSDVLFCHDDIILTDPHVFDEISQIDYDQCYIFKSRDEDRVNGGKHGRCIFMSYRFLEFTKNYPCKCKFCTLRYRPNLREYYYVQEPNLGFYYDRYNFGFTAGRRPEFSRDYNQGIAHYHAYLGKIRDRKALSREGIINPELKVLGRIYISAMDTAKRGNFKRYPRGRLHGVE